MGTSDHNFSSVVSFLNRNLRKTSVQLAETPCYFHVGKEAKLEVTVFANPGIASIDVRMIKINNFDRDPYFERSYDLHKISVASFQRDIEDLIYRTNTKEK